MKPRIILVVVVDWRFLVTLAVLYSSGFLGRADVLGFFGHDR